MNWIDSLQNIELWTTGKLETFLSYENLALAFIVVFAMFLLNLLLILKIKKQIKLQKIFYGKTRQCEAFNVFIAKLLLKTLSEAKLNQTTEMKNRDASKSNAKRHSSMLSIPEKETREEPGIVKKLINSQPRAEEVCSFYNQEGVYYVHDRIGRKDFGKH